MATARKPRLTQVQIERISRALADPRRFAILQQIAAKDVVACSGLKIHECLSPATISHHLKELQEAELIEVEREGRTASLALRRDIWAAYVDRLGQI